MTETSPKPIVTTAPFPANEVERLEALRRYNILDTPPEVAFDRITSLAARLFNMPITLVSLVDESRGWFKSAYGFDMREVRRDTTICSFALLSNEVLVIPDTRQDSRLVCNPFVQNEPGLRFYAGAPLLTQDGFNLGTLCLLDTKPRDGLSDEQKSVLSDLAAMVMDELELRLAARKVAQMDAALLEVTQGVSTATGEAFFSALVQHMLKVLGVDYVYIGLVDPHNQEIIRTIAACAKGQIIENFEYLLHDTPCEQVLEKRKLCCYPHRVQALFPKAPLLEPLGIESYVAVPFFDTTGVPLGLLGVMDGNALTNVQLAESLLTIFALRIATELERQQTEAARQQAQYELERLVEQRTSELSQANELLQVLLDNVQAGIVACDAEGILTSFNQAARQFHGLPEQALPPEEWAKHYDLYLPDGKTRMSKNEIPLFRALQGQTVKNDEMVIAPKHGKVKTLLASGQAIVDNEGKKQGAVVVMHDITERKIAEAELLISDVALKQMPDAILLTDLEGNIQRWLGNAEQIFGYTATEVIGKPVSFLHHPDIKSTQTAEIIRDLQETGAFCGEIACLRKDGSPVPIETTAKTVYDKAGNPIFIIGINRDITERKQAEAERTQLMRQQVQEQSARLKAEEANRIKDEFLAVLSHELRTPLNPILGWTKLLRAGKLDSAKTDYALETIERNAKLQTQLIGDLLDVSRILQGKLSLSMAAVNLAPTISAAIETVQLTAQAKSIQIETVFDLNVGQVLGDSARLQQVVWNLLSNAVKFTENGGRVEIRLGCVDSQAEIKVSDTGKGISPDFLPHVFESFRQADATITRKFGGLGLGLAIVRHLVELHGGTIYAESPGEDLGATFTVRLPLIAVVKTR